MQSRLLSYMGLILVAVIWGLNFGFTREEMTKFDPILFVFLRFSLAVPFFFILLKLKEGSIGIPFKVAVKLLVIGLLGVTLLESIVVYSIKYTTLANASILNVAPWPIFTALLAPFFTRELITRRVIFGGIAAMIGVCLIILSGGEGFDLSSSNMKGNLLAFSVSIIGAIYNLSCMKLMKTYSVLRMSTWFILFGTIGLFPLTLGSWGKVAWSNVYASDYLILGYNVFIATIAAFLIWNICMLRVGAARSNFFRYVVTVAAVLAGYFMYDEVITVWQVVGALFMAAGLVWISMERKITSIAEK